MRVYPPLLSCLAYAFKTFGVIYIALFLVSVILNVIKHRPLIASFGDAVPTVVVIFLAIPVALAAVVYLGARVWAWSFDQNGLTGRSYWGRRVAIRWSDVASVRNTSVEGIPALLIGSSSDKKELFAYTLGVSIADVYIRLYQYAGPEHVLTQAFKPA